MQKRTLVIIILGAAAFLTVTVFILFVVFSPSLRFTLSTTERAVIFYPYSKGLDKENVLCEGSHLIAPWNDKIVYDVFEHSLDESIEAIDKNAWPIHIDVTIRYSPQPDKIGYLHQSFHGEYKERFVIPEASSSIRQIMAQYQAEEIYSTKRTEIEATLREEIKKKYDANYLILNDILIRSIKLPNQTH